VKELTISDFSQREIQWNATDSKGRNVSEGIYFMQWQQGNLRGTDKVLIIK